MGACDFSTIQIVKGDDKLAFREARKEANEENGHQEGYSGDIQTCHGYTFVRKHPRTGSKKFYDWVERQYEALDKRECICVEFSPASTKRLKEKYGLKGRKGYRAFYFFGSAAE